MQFIDNIKIFIWDSTNPSVNYAIQFVYINELKGGRFNGF